MVAKKATKKVKDQKTSEPTEIFSSSSNGSPRFSDYFNFTESYTSLILGIVVVIIASLLLVSFFQNRRLGNFKNVKQDISATNTVDKSKLNLPTATISAALARNVTPPIEPTDPAEPTAPEAPQDAIVTITPPNAPLTITPTKAAILTAVQATATATPMPTVTKAPTATLIPTKKPTVSPVATRQPTATTMPTKQPTATVAPTKQPSVTPVPTKAVAQAPTQAGKTYSVQEGESLWSIAEKTYKDGYKWVEIAKANNLANPNAIEKEQKLQLPQIDTKAVAQDTGKNTEMNAPNNLPKTYTVMKGDDLWDIAVKMYNDGYKWTEIAKANKLTNPNTIHSGNVLTIPR